MNKKGNDEKPKKPVDTNIVSEEIEETIKENEAEAEIEAEEQLVTVESIKNLIEEPNDIKIKKLLENNNLSELGRFSNTREVFSFFDDLVERKVIPAKTSGEALSVVLAGLEKGIKPITALNKMYPINGKISYYFDFIVACLIKAGVSYEIVRNYAPLQIYEAKDKILYTKDDINFNPDIFKIVNSESEVKNDDIIYVKFLGVTRVTEVLFKRTLNNVELKHTEIFTMLMAERAGLLSKDNWIKYPNRCLLARTLSLGGRTFAPDVIEFPEVTELLLG